MTYLLLLVAGCTSAREALAREVFRCRGADGVLAFTDTPCPAGSAALGTIKVDAAAPRGAAADRGEAQRIAAWERASRAKLPPSLGGAPRPARVATPAARAAARPRPGTGAEERCNAARAARDAAYADRNGPGFEQRRRLQDAIDDACGLR